jgi:2,4-diaminopentanoate dehydrogenase
VSSHQVVLWGPGQVGVGALRAIIRHPGLELAGVVVHSEAKDGKDAGDLCGMPATGVIATRDIDAALATDADAIAYFASGDYRLDAAAGDVARCLRAGRDVVTTSLVPLCFPPAADPKMVAMLEAACRDGGTSLFNSGVEPGWINDIVPIVLSGMSERIDRVTSQEILDYGGIAQPEIMFDFMGFAHPDGTDIPLLEGGRLIELWSPSVHIVAAALGLVLDEVVTSVERWIAPETYDVASGTVPAGTMGAMRFRLIGLAGGEERIVIDHVTRMGAHTAPEWPTHPSPHGGYRIILDGMPTYTLDLEIHGRGDNLRGLTFATVMRPLNAIPAVVAAPPGVLSALDVPVVPGPMAGAAWTGLLP